MKSSDSVKRLFETIAKSSENLKRISAESKAAVERSEKLTTEMALGRSQRKSALADFVDDLVHRPPNAEQIRQLKEAILEEQKMLSQILELIEKWDQESVIGEKSAKDS